MAIVLAGCVNNETGKEVQLTTPPSRIILPTLLPRVSATIAPTIQPTIQPSPTLVVLGPLFDSDLDLWAEPVEVPLRLQIPSLKVNAPVVGVGLTAENKMDSPKGPIGDPLWHTAFWYRGSGIPGEPGTATITGHVNDPLGRHEIFANLEDLKPGDHIIIYYSALKIDIRFVVDEVKVYSIQESSDPLVLAKIFGDGPIAGIGPQPSLDGSSHLTLITCAGNIVNGEFDHHTIVFTTRVN
ncbi:MAG TPA: class F sortase [Anaerolineaceae bacterium]|nr:class F sortase [Anaerolineaceae bacterium]